MTEIFPDEESAVRWFEAIHWAEGRYGCKSYFGMRTGTSMEKSWLPLRKWVFATYLYVTSLKGVSSMKPDRDLKVTQKTAWYMIHRLREAWDECGLEAMLGPIEVDETYHGRQAEEHVQGEAEDTHGPRVVSCLSTNKPTLQGFIGEHAAPGATVYIDKHGSYEGMPFDHEAVSHSAGEYVRGAAHTNGMESLWATMKRAHRGVYHHWSPKHMDRYVAEFAARHNIRDEDAIDQMQSVAVAMVGKQLSYQELIAD